MSLHLFNMGLGFQAAETPAPPDDYLFPYPQEPGLMYTNKQMHQTYGTYSVDYGDQVVYDAATNCSHIVVMQKEGGAYYADSLIVRYNHNTNAFDRHFVVPMQAYGTTRDYHVHGVLAKVGTEILFICEQQHNNVMRVFKSVDGDIRKMQHKGLTHGTGGGYPKIYVKGQRVVCVYRGPDRQFHNTWCSVSNDGGETWVDNYGITTQPADGGVTRHYSQKPIQDHNGHWHLVVKKRENAATNSGYRYSKAYWLVSEDGGVTWRNLQNTFSKVVRPSSTVNNLITEAELDQHFMFASAAEDTIDSIESHGQCVLPTGEIISQTGRHDQGGGTAMRVFSNGSWSVKPYSHPVDTRDIAFYAHNLQVWDRVVTEMVGAYQQLARYRTTDGGATWSRAEQYSNLTTTRQWFNYFGVITGNYGAAKKMVAIGLVSENPLKTFYSDLMIREINAIAT